MDVGVATRPMRADDDVRLERMWPRLSPDTVYRRFHSPLRRLPAATVHHLVAVGPHPGGGGGGRGGGGGGGGGPFPPPPPPPPPPPVAGGGGGARGGVGPP